MTRDASIHPELTDRQLYILSALIRAYTDHPEPVSSKQLVEEYEVNVSSATVRNELAVLEQLGMVRAPHTSAGRIPTEEGYRYFVGHLIHEKALSEAEQRTIRAEFEKIPRQMKQWIQTAALVLASQTQTAALVTEPRALATTFKHMELISTQGHLVLMVLVLEGGDVLQQMLTLTTITSQDQLTQVTAMINDTCQGNTASSISQKILLVMDFLAQEVMELVVELMREAEQGTTYALHWHGFGDLISQFDEGEGAQQALRILDEKSVIQNVLAEALDDNQQPYKVLVGGEGRFEEISELSIVISRYGTDQLTGAISVLGPKRMRYGRAINTVRYVATLMSAMMKDVYGTDN
jgi:heat-inducible transcriptional repressor